MAKAVQELNAKLEAENEELRTKNAELEEQFKSENDELCARIERLEKLIEGK